MSKIDLSPLDEYFSGNRLKQYQLLERIGYGGQAVVWSALDHQQKRMVAIKLSLPERDVVGEVDPKTDWHVFERQARFVAAFDHPNILPLYDFGITDRLRYMVMPYVPAGSLRDLLDREPFLPYDLILSITAEIVSALDYVHRRNIVHRDLKSTNILLDFSRHAYLADFGLARVISLTTESLHTGRGTPPYAPPEQHSASRLTPQSDIYSLGILLFEMFTSHLPWDGEKSLGILQLSQSVQLSDPREFNPDLPAGLVGVLRRMTAPKPQDRPKSVVEALRLVRESLPGSSTMAETVHPQPASVPLSQVENARVILERGFERWSRNSAPSYTLSLTEYVYVETAYQQSSNDELPLGSEYCQFMLHGALVHGHHVDFWWQQVAEPRCRQQVCISVIENGTELAVERAVAQMRLDVIVGQWDISLPPSAVSRLIDVASKTEDARLCRLILILLQSVVEPGDAWQKTRFSVLSDMQLADLALSGDRVTAVEAARLVGHIRSETAVQVILGEANEFRRMSALMSIHETAESLPRSIPSSLRMEVLGGLLLKNLGADKPGLVKACLTIVLGCFLGFWIHIYLTYRWLELFDATRVLIAIERGIFLGLIVGLGIFAVRLVVQRLVSISLLPRLVGGVAIGSLLINLAFFGFSVFFLDVVPTGWGIALGCIVIALGFALGSGLLRSKLLRMLIAMLTLMGVFSSSWALHLMMSMDPLLRYDYTWTARQVWPALTLTSLPIAVMGNLIDLAVRPRQKPGQP